MYYEAIRLKRYEVDSIETAILAKGTPQLDDTCSSPRIASFNAITLDISGITIYLVSDVHIDDPDWAEIAIIAEYKNHKAQIESYTGKVLGVPQLYEVIADYFMDEYDITWCKAAKLNFELTGKEEAQFICGCCGSWFTGNVKEQLAHDQDNGYGICNDCN